MKFTYKKFSCDTEKYELKNKGFIIKFFDETKIQKEMVNYVLADPGFGYISVRFVGQDALLSGFMDEKIFTEEMVDEVVEFVYSMIPNPGYIPYNVMRVKFTDAIEYNGEY